MKMALVHLRHAAIGGTERILNEVSRRLAERGHEVTILCRSHVEPSHPSLRFEVLQSPVIGSAWRMWAFAAAVERHVRAVPYDLVYSLGRTWSQDVIRCSGGSHTTWLEQVRRAQHGAASWRSRLHALKDHLAIAIERRAYAPGAYRKVIVNSKLVRDDLAARYAIPDECIEIVYNGVDLARFHPEPSEHRAELRRELGAGSGEIVFLFLGTGFERKGLERLLHAFVDVARHSKSARLWVVGRDSEQARYEASSARLGLAERVKFFGERRDAQRFFAAADVYVLPTWYDSFGFTVLEALACGTPAITTDHAGASELIERGINGEVLTAACEPAELAHTLIAWCERERHVAARSTARLRAESFGFDSTMGRMIEILEDTAARPRPHSSAFADAARD